MGETDQLEHLPGSRPRVGPVVAEQGAEEDQVLEQRQARIEAAVAAGGDRGDAAETGVGDRLAAMVDLARE